MFPTMSVLRFGSGADGSEPEWVSGLMMTHPSWPDSVSALKLDPAKRRATWVTLNLSDVRALEDAAMNMALLSAAASEFVDPRTYVAVAKALGLDSWSSVAPYKLASKFLGARAVLWVLDNDPQGLPATRLAFEGHDKPTGRWLGTSFLIAYPKVPKTLPEPQAVSDTASVRPGTAPLCAAHVTESLWGEALDTGALRVEWLTAQEAASASQLQFSLDLTLNPTRAAAEGGGSAGVAVSFREKVLNHECAKCSKSCRKLCSRCKQVAYCNEECQRNHWREHKSVCVGKN